MQGMLEVGCVYLTPRLCGTKKCTWASHASDWKCTEKNEVGARHFQALSHPSCLGRACFTNTWIACKAVIQASSLGRAAGLGGSCLCSPAWPHTAHGGCSPREWGGIFQSKVKPWKYIEGFISQWRKKICYFWGLCVNKYLTWKKETERSENGL